MMQVSFYFWDFVVLGPLLFVRVDEKSYYKLQTLLTTSIVNLL